MYSIKSVFIAVVSVSVIIFSAYAAEQKPSATPPGKTSNSTVLDVMSDWSVYMEAPDYHFKLANKYLQNGDYSNAASELKRGNSFLVFQQNRLSAISKVIEELSNGLATGKNKDITNLDSVTSNALKVLSNKYAMIPLEVGAIMVFEEEYEYRFDKAKIKLQENNRAEAGSEIRRAASLLKLKAAHIATISKAELDSAEHVLKNLASNVESGVVTDAKELDRAFQKALLGAPKPKK